MTGRRCGGGGRWRRGSSCWAAATSTASPSSSPRPRPGRPDRRGLGLEGDPSRCSSRSEGDARHGVIAPHEMEQRTSILIGMNVCNNGCRVAGGSPASRNPVTGGPGRASKNGQSHGHVTRSRHPQLFQLERAIFRDRAAAAGAAGRLSATVSERTGGRQAARKSLGDAGGVGAHRSDRPGRPGARAGVQSP